MADTIIFGEESGSKVSRESADRLGLANASVDIADVRTYVDEYTKISKVNNWERMSMSTAQGAVSLDISYFNNMFDGRYIYYCPYNADTFLRFDTQGTSFATAGNWERVSMSTVAGAMVNAAYPEAVFDGRYVYYATFSALTFLRFDTKGTSFTTTADWSQMSVSTAQGAAAVTLGYYSVSYDGRYVYYSPFNSDTFMRFDTQGTSFTTVADWQKMNMSTAQGGVVLNSAYIKTIFDGKYIYFTPFNSDTFLRFDTQGTSFTTADDWQKMNMSTAQGAIDGDSAFLGSIFDGRYIYYCPRSADTFLRFDTQGTSFATAGDWEQMSMSTAQGGVAIQTAFSNIAFDGRYVYYSPINSDTFVKFDTQGTSFTTAGDWQKMSMSTALGITGLDAGFYGAAYDGKYTYFSAYNSDTFLRVLATPLNV